MPLLETIQTYVASECAVFKKTKEAHGGCSNMAGGFPLNVNGHSIRTSEAIYQALRFPDYPDIQRDIFNEKSPMSAKMVAKAHIEKTRLDWMEIRIPVMRWCLQLKLSQNRETFGAVLLGTGDLEIVENSRKDDFWGAIPTFDCTKLTGRNVLGKLLMELRQNVWIGVQPLEVPRPLLFGEPIRYDFSGLVKPIGV